MLAVTGQTEGGGFRGAGSWKPSVAKPSTRVRTETPHRRAILAGTSAKGCCPVCGKPWTRIVETHHNGQDWNHKNRNPGNHMVVGQSAAYRIPPDYQSPTTVGWRPQCSHDAEPVPCAVLDPFSGAGTTLLSAHRLGRRGIGIELKPEYAEMSKQRILTDAPLLYTATTYDSVAGK